jgi:hypothetical protein
VIDVGTWVEWPIVLRDGTPLTLHGYVIALVPPGKRAIDVAKKLLKKATHTWANLYGGMVSAVETPSYLVSVPQGVGRREIVYHPAIDKLVVSVIPEEKRTR